MATSEKLFINILKAFDKEDVLKDLLIIGGWCLIIYRQNFGNPATISSIRTAGIDFLVPTNHKFTHNIDINEVFSELGFEEVFSVSKGYIKYVHPELEVEFLVPLVGRPIDKPYTISALKTNAQRLRFLDILVQYSKQVNYANVNVNVPEPAAFVINKIITSTRRDDPLKKLKDLKAAKELGEYILNDSFQKSLLQSIFNSYGRKIKKTIIDTTKQHSEKLYNHLTLFN